MYDPDSQALALLQTGQQLSPADTVAVLSRLAQHAPDIAFCGQVEAHVADVATRLYDAAVTSTDARISAAAGEIILAQNAQLSQHGAHVDERLRTLADYVRRNVQSSLEGFNAHMQEQHNNVTAVLEARLGAMTAEAGARDASRALETRSLLARQEALMHGALAQSSTAVLTTADAAAQARSDATAAHLRAELLEERASSEARIAQAAAQAESRAIGVATRLYGTTEESRRATLNSARDAAARLREAVEALRLRTDALEETSLVTADEVANAAQLAAAARQSASQASKEHTLLANRLQRESKKLQDLLETKLDALAATDATLQHQLTASRHAGEELERRVNDLRRSLDRRDSSPLPVNDEVERALLRLSQRLDAAERAAAERDAFADQLESRIHAIAEQLTASRKDVVTKLDNIEKMITAKFNQIETNSNLAQTQRDHTEDHPVENPQRRRPAQVPSHIARAASPESSSDETESDTTSQRGQLDHGDDFDVMHRVEDWSFASKREVRSTIADIEETLTCHSAAAQKRVTAAIAKIKAHAMAAVDSPIASSPKFLRELSRLVWLARASFAEGVGLAEYSYMSTAFEAWTAKHKTLPDNAAFLAAALKAPKPKPANHIRGRGKPRAAADKSSSGFQGGRQ